MADEYDVEVAEWQAIVRRDPDAFSRWFARCEVPLRQTLRSFAHVVDVEAIVQDTALKLWERASTVAPDGRNFLLRWTRTVALNAARTAAARPGNRVEHQQALPSEDTLVDRDTDRRPDFFWRTRVRQCFDRLPLQQLRVISARIEDCGTRRDREIAASLSMSFDTFRQSLTRARKGLVNCLRASNIDVTEYLR